MTFPWSKDGYELIEPKHVHMSSEPCCVKFDKNPVITWQQICVRFTTQQEVVLVHRFVSASHHLLLLSAAWCLCLSNMSVSN